VFVNLLVMSMCCAETDELIKMLFGMWTRERRLGLGNHYYVGPPDRWGQTSERVCGWGHHGECGAQAYNVGSGGRAYNNEFILPKTVCFVTVHALPLVSELGGPECMVPPTSSLGGYA